MNIKKYDFLIKCLKFSNKYFWIFMDFHRILFTFFSTKINKYRRHVDASSRIDQPITMKNGLKLKPFEKTFLLNEYLVYMFTE